MKRILTLVIIYTISMIQPMFAQTFEPPDGKVLLFIGQDIETVRSYVDSSDYFPDPSGVVSYVSFYDVLNDRYPQYGALGEYPDGSVYEGYINWGAGLLHGHYSAHDFPNSTLQIGLAVEETWIPNGLDSIALGVYDAEIIRLAKFLNDLGDIPVYLRIGFEFDGTWNKGYEDTDDFINAWQHMVDVLRQQGVDNTAYVWQASSSPLDDIIEGRKENPMDWYPGDDYVDWVGMSWFVRLDEESTTRTTISTQRELLDEMLTIARDHNKPVIIAESAPQGYSTGELINLNMSYVWDGPAAQDTVYKTAAEIWEEWYQPYFEYIHENDDVIKAVTYINTWWESQPKWNEPWHEGYWGDSRVQVNDSIRVWWQEELSNEVWLHGSAELFDTLWQDTSLTTVGRGESVGSVHSYRLSQNYPNPFNPKTTIEFTITHPANVTLTLYNLLGQKVMVIFSGRLGKGLHRKVLNSDNLPSGTYYYELKANENRLVKKCIIVK